MDRGTGDVEDSCNIDPQQRSYTSEAERSISLRIMRQLADEHRAGIAPSIQNPAVTTMTEQGHRSEIGNAESHLVSSVTARLVSTLYPFTLQDCIHGRWEFENISENVGIRELDDVRWHEGNAVHVRCLINTTTVEIGDDSTEQIVEENSTEEEVGEDNRITELRENTILLRHIMDYSHQLNGHPFSRQIIWSSKFTCEEIIQSLEDNTRIFDFIHEAISFNTSMIHDMDALVKASLAMKCLSTIIVFHDNGEESLCVICHDSFSIGASTKQLPCNHSYHSDCIFKWFGHQISCPICRDDTVSYCIDFT